MNQPKTFWIQSPIFFDTFGMYTSKIEEKWREKNPILNTVQDVPISNKLVRIRQGNLTGP